MKNPRLDGVQVRRGGRAAGVVLALWLAACSGDIGGPQAAIELEVAGGDAQQGLPGKPLLNPVVFQARTTDGLAVAGVSIHVDVGSGTASAPTTDSRGQAPVHWRLGDDPGPQSLRAWIDGGQEVIVTAEALPPALSDVVVFPTGAEPGAAAVLVKGGATPLSAVWAGPVVDGSVVLPPQREPGLDLVVFTRSGAPLVWQPSWTPGPDTVIARPLAPTRVDLEILILETPFETFRQMAEDHLAQVSAIWREQGLGAVLGEVTFRDVGSPGANIDSYEFCSQQPSQTVRVLYVRSVNQSSGTGWACRNRAAMGSKTDASPALLAHELGHLFGLDHRGGTNLMNPSPPGPEITEGQIFFAHYHETSVLNTLFGTLPEELQRDCRPFVAGVKERCFDPEYQLQF